MMKEIFARGPISCTLGAEGLMLGYDDNAGVQNEGGRGGDAGDLPAVASGYLEDAGVPLHTSSTIP